MQAPRYVKVSPAQRSNVGAPGACAAGNAGAPSSVLRLPLVLVFLLPSYPSNAYYYYYPSSETKMPCCFLIVSLLLENQMLLLPTRFSLNSLLRHC